MYSKRKIIHIDMDAFYASIEQKDNPELRGKPLIVGGNPQSRGVVAACSYEARAFGIHSAMPCSKASRLCPHAIFTRPRMDRYKEISIKVMEIFGRYTGLVEPLSLDEAFLDVTVNSLQESSATYVAEKIRQQIFDELGLTASAGISFNKFLAKVASDVDKPNGTTTVPPQKALEFIRKLPIRKFFGVGRVTEKKMQRLGILTGRDLSKWDEKTLVFHFGKTGSFLYDTVRAIDDRPVQPSRIRKSIGSETTLTYDTNDTVEINAILAKQADRVAKSLDKKKTGGHTLTLKLRYHDFTTVTRSLTSKTPFYTADNMLNLTPRLLGTTLAGEKKVRLIGLSVSKLTDQSRRPRQLLLPFMMDS